MAKKNTNRSRQYHCHGFNPRFTELSVESLEQRLLLSGTPSLSGIGPRILSGQGLGLDMIIEAVHDLSVAFTWHNKPSFVDLVDHGDNTLSLAVDPDPQKPKGLFTFDITATDSHGSSDTETMVVTVDYSHEPPLVVSPLGGGHHDIRTLANFGGRVIVSHNTTGEDVEMQALSLPSGATFAAGMGVYAWSPPQNMTGEFDLTFQARSTISGYTTRTTAVLNVEQSIGAPVLTQRVPELSGIIGDTLTVNLAAVDPESDPVFFSFADNDPDRFASGISVTGCDGGICLEDYGNGTATLQFTPGAEARGYEYVRIKASDDNGHTAVFPVAFRIGQLVHAVQDGDFSDPTTWEGGIVPGVNHRVMIQGHTVSYSGNHQLGELTVQQGGVLEFSRFKDSYLQMFGSILVLAGGTLDVGTEQEPIPAGREVDISFVVPHDDILTGNDNRFMGEIVGMPDFIKRDIGLFGMGMGSTTTIYGEERERVWTRLASDVAVGAREIELEHAVDWRVGDRILVAPWADMSEQEFRTIVAINGRTLMLDIPLVNYRPGQLYARDSGSNQLRHINRSSDLRAGEVLVREQAEVALLTRNVTIRSDFREGEGHAHTLLMMNGTGYFGNAEFKDLGPRRLGRYSVHLHRVGGVEENAFVRHNAIWNEHGPGHKGVVVHDTNNLSVVGNVIATNGSVGIYLEAATEFGNTIAENLVVGIKGPETFPNPALALKLGYEGFADLSTGIWGRTGNEFINNVVVGVESPQHAFGIVISTRLDGDEFIEVVGDTAVVSGNYVRATQVGVGLLGTALDVDFDSGVISMSDDPVLTLSDLSPEVINTVVFGVDESLPPEHTGNVELTYYAQSSFDLSSVPSRIRKRDLDSQRDVTLSYGLTHGLFDGNKQHTFGPQFGVNFEKFADRARELSEQVSIRMSSRSRVHGRVFDDVNLNGRRNVGENYLNGWTIDLLDDLGNIVETTTTMDEDLNRDGVIDPDRERGWFWFAWLPRGSYTVRQAPLQDWHVTTPVVTEDLFSQRAFNLDEELGFFSSGNMHENWGGLEEKWLQAANNGSQWYYVTPAGDLYEWDNASGRRGRKALRGDLVARFDPQYHSDPSLLYEASPVTPSNVHIVQVRSDITTGLDFGNVELGAAVLGRKFNDVNGNGLRDNSEPFLNGVTIELRDLDGNIVQRTMTRDRDLDRDGTIDPDSESGWYRFENIGVGTYAINDRLANGWIRTSQTDGILRDAYELDQQLELYSSGELYENWGGRGEKWLQAASEDDQWYFITPNGRLFRWDNVSGPSFGTPLGGKPVMDLTVRFHARPSLLFEAVPHRAHHVLVETGMECIKGLDFGVTLVERSLSGRVWDDLNDSGHRDANERYLNRWRIQLLNDRNEVVATTRTSDVDLNNDGVIDPSSERGWYSFDELSSDSFTVRQLVRRGWRSTSHAVEFTAAKLDRELGLFTTDSLHENWGGRNEKWVRAANEGNQWYFITPNGEVSKWDNSSGRSFGSPLNGTVVATLSSSFHADPTTLTNALGPRHEVSFEVLDSVISNLDFGNMRTR